MVTIPDVPPVTIPDVEPTVAPPELLHVPPEVPGSDNTMELPTHTCPAPEMAEGNGLTVTVREVIQPAGDV
jgi:hypothetical protein